MSWIKNTLNDAAMDAVNRALENGDVELYNELKEEYWIIDFTDLMEERENAI